MFQLLWLWLSKSLLESFVTVISILETVKSCVHVGYINTLVPVRQCAFQVNNKYIIDAYSYTLIHGDTIIHTRLFIFRCQLSAFVSWGCLVKPCRVYHNKLMFLYLSRIIESHNYTATISNMFVFVVVVDWLTAM